MMLERIFDHMLAHTGVRMVTMREMAEDFKRRHPFNGTTEGAPAARLGEGRELGRRPARCAICAVGSFACHKCI